MNLSLLLLKSGEYLISQVEQMEYEPSVHMIEPYLIGGKTKVTLTRWPSHTDDKHILINSGSLLTMCDPTQDLLDKYLVKIGKTMEDFEPKDDRVMLTEGEQVPGPLPDETDEYEPRYVEEPLY